MIFQQTLRWLLFLFLGMAAISVFAQSVPDWQQAYEQMAEDFIDDEDGAPDVDMQLLQHLADHPINLNNTNREELEQLPFLSQQQVMDLIEYLDRYRPMRSLGELRMVRSMSYQQLTLLPYFVYLGEYVPPATARPPLKPHHTLTATGSIPFYDRQGDKSGYLGYKYRHSLRYEFSYGKKIKAGLIGAQDAGEPFFSNRNTWGYDAYSYYVQVSELGPVSTAIVGKYKLSAGMGLVLNNAFSMGKTITLQSLGRLTQGLRPHSSRSEQGYFQGAAATIAPCQPLTLTLFASHRAVDATLNDDGTAKTLIYSGMHRTPEEMQKKYNTHLTALGATSTFHKGAFHVGSTTVFTHPDRSLEPDRTQRFRYYYPHGEQFFNASLFYGYNHSRWAFRGETAINQDGALATIHTLSHQTKNGTSITALHRFYSCRYTSLYANSFSDASGVQNESGIYLGASCRPLSHLQLQAYADYAYFPWARYRVSQASQSLDLFLQADYRLTSKWDLAGRLRARFREQDNADKTALVPLREQRGRFAATYHPSSALSLKSQVDLSRMSSPDVSRGLMFSQQATYQKGKHLLSGTAAFFHTDDYNSRLYLYERQVRYDFSFPMYYGRGMRLMLLARATISPRLQLTAKLGHTNYFDRSSIGTSQQLIAHSSATDLILQLRYHL